MAEITTLGAPIKTAYEGQPNTNAFTDDEKDKLGDLPDTVALQSLFDEKVSSVPVTGAGKILNSMSLTQAQFDAIPTPNSQTLYIITDA